MMRPKSAMFYIKVLEDISSDLIDVLSLKRDSSGEIDDLLKYAHQWSLESICAIFLDARLGCLDENQAEDSDGKHSPSGSIIHSASTSDMTTQQLPCITSLRNT